MKTISLITLTAISLMLSACSMLGLGSDKKEAVAMSQQAKLEKAIKAPASAAKCAADGFCALPGIKKYQKAK